MEKAMWPPESRGSNVNQRLTIWSMIGQILVKVTLQKKRVDVRLQKLTFLLLLAIVLTHATEGLPSPTGRKLAAGGSAAAWPNGSSAVRPAAAAATAESAVESSTGGDSMRHRVKPSTHHPIRANLRRRPQRRNTTLLGVRSLRSSSTRRIRRRHIRPRVRRACLRLRACHLNKAGGSSHRLIQ